MREKVRFVKREIQKQFGTFVRKKGIQRRCNPFRA